MDDKQKEKLDDVAAFIFKEKILPAIQEELAKLEDEPVMFSVISRIVRLFVSVDIFMKYHFAENDGPAAEVTDLQKKAGYIAYTERVYDHILDDYINNDDDSNNFLKMSLLRLIKTEDEILKGSSPDSTITIEFTS